MPDQPHIEILARALVRCCGHVLVCRHVPQGGYLVLPGGHVDFGETAAVAAAREFHEEVGVVVRAGRCLAGLEQIFEQRQRVRHEITLVFHVEHPPEWNGSTPPQLVSPEEPKVVLEWLPESDIGAVDLRPATIRRWLVAHIAAGADPASAPMAWLA